MFLRMMEIYAYDDNNMVRNEGLCIAILRYEGKYTKITM